ncbi:VOC family protein [Microbacterium sp. QXD-8]|uniref:VOC family protein n=1 Tax=Microbacterium psychrotolerans TaxID=3068321 RepID=A0ABU0YXA6_9MICO|nr:VOC family protein [Microbacterium sp. QXD-8]MDQ7876952.1 VOC family protein [Microbacterium sp. QXD-8]
MLRGFATISYYAVDLDAASRWYAEVLGIEPYFVTPAYIEFRVGDYEHELGIIDAQYRPPMPDGPAGAVMQWAVDDVHASLARLLELGATEYQPVIERGHGFSTAAVVDPFGNILGIMENPHYLEIVERDRARRAPSSE